MKHLFRKHFVPLSILTLLALAISLPVLLSHGQIFLPDHILREGVHTLDWETLLQSPGLVVEAGLALFAQVVSVSFTEKLLLLLTLLLPMLSMYFYLRRHLGALFAVVGGVLFLFNPFMYERFVSGQWFVMLGLAYLPILLAAFERMLRDADRKSVLAFSILYAVYPLVSLHYWYISTLILIVYASVWVLLYKSWRYVSPRVLVGAVALIAATFLIVNGYWLMSFFTPSSTYSVIDARDFVVFIAKNDIQVGVILNVLFGYGFWREGVILPKDVYPLWWLPSAMLLLTALIGIYISARKKFSSIATQPFSILARTLGGVLPIVAALAVGHSFGATGKLVELCYQYLPGFSGLRETGKLVGIVMFAVAVFVPVFLEQILAGLQLNVGKQRTLATATLAGIFATLALATAFTFFAGAMGQVAMSEYPNSWREADRLLSSELQAKSGATASDVLALPWRGYITLDWAGNTYVANPSRVFFSIPVETSRSTGNVRIDEKYTTEYDRTLNRILDVPSERASQVSELKQMGVGYFILLHTDDWRRYLPFVSDSVYFEQIYQAEEISVYRVK